ncbi:MAG: hypothetical protein AAB546_00415 [Patescibacteria group bacterium]
MTEKLIDRDDIAVFPCESKIDGLLAEPQSELEQALQCLADFKDGFSEYYSGEMVDVKKLGTDMGYFVLNSSQDNPIARTILREAAIELMRGMVKSETTFDKRVMFDFNQVVRDKSKKD